MINYVVMPKSNYISACNAIREKISSSEPIKSSELEDKINSVYQNGYEQGKSEVTPAKEEQEKNVDIDKNGMMEILPDENKVLSKVIVNVDIESKDEYHELMWNGYQRGGNRYDYEKAFCNLLETVWIIDMIRPLYDFTVNIANSMFRGLTDLIDFNEFLDDRNKSFTFILNPKNQSLAQAGYMFSGCINLVSAVDLDLEKVSTIIYFFNGCTKLETAELKNIQKNTTLDGAFNTCSTLKNLTITGEIGSNIDLKWSPLTAESAKSVITHLAVYIGTEKEFACKVSFHNSVWELLDAEGNTAPHGGTWKDYVDNIGWNR